MKTLIASTLLTITLATHALAGVLNVNCGTRLAAIPHRWVADGVVWNGYNTLTDRHHADGWRPVTGTPACPPHHEIENVYWTDEGDSAVYWWSCTPVVPSVVTRYRFWLAFAASTGYSNRDVETVILTWPEGPDRTQALIALDNARDYRRDNPFVTALQAELGLTNEEMDGIFITAIQLEVD